MRRVLSLVTLLILVCIAFHPTPAATQTGTLLALIKLVSGTGQAADALEKFIKAIGTSYDTAMHVADDVSERRDRRELEDINKTIAGLYGDQRSFLDAIDDYLKRPNPGDWADIFMRTDKLVNTITQLFRTLDRERTGLVYRAPEAYYELVETLEARGGMLQKLRHIDQPKTKDELNQLRLFKTQYARLVANLKEASLKLSAYTKNRYPKKTGQ